MMPNTPLKEHYNLWSCIQHLIHESEYEYDDDEFDNPLDEHNWLLQARGKYMKFVICHSSNVTEPRQTSNHKLVSFIHNFCIDHGNAKPLQCYEHDPLTLMDFVNNNDDDNPHPLGLLCGGELFIDIPEGRRGSNRRSQ